MNTDLPKIRLIQHGRVNRITQMLQAALIREQEEWGSVRLFAADVEEFYEIHSITGFSGDCKTHIIIDDDVWDEILTYMDLSTDEDIAASRLLLFDKAGNAIHELFPIGQQGDEIYLAIDDINNVDFELDLDNDDDDDDDDDDILEDDDDDDDIFEDDDDVAESNDENDVFEKYKKAAFDLLDHDSSKGSFEDHARSVFGKNGISFDDDIVKDDDDDDDDILKDDNDVAEFRKIARELTNHDSSKGSFEDHARSVFEKNGISFDDDIVKDDDDDDIVEDDDDNDDDNDIIEVDGLAEFLKSLADKDEDALDTKSGWDTDLRQIVLGNHSLEQWKEIVLIVNCDSDDEETISITSTFRGDLKTYCVLTADEWQEIRQSMKGYDADNCKLEIRDGGWGESHALIPIGQRGDDVYLAIDDINNVEFEFED